METVDTTLPNVKGEFKMYTSGVRPVKATGTRWINHAQWIV